MKHLSGPQGLLCSVTSSILSDLQCRLHLQNMNSSGGGYGDSSLCSTVWPFIISGTILVCNNMYLLLCRFIDSCRMLADMSSYGQYFWSSPFTSQFSCSTSSKNNEPPRSIGHVKQPKSSHTVIMVIINVSPHRNHGWFYLKSQWRAIACEGRTRSFLISFHDFGIQLNRN